MRLSEYLEQDGLGLAKLIRERAVTEAEVLDCARRLAEALNPEINAFVEIFPEPPDRSSSWAAGSRADCGCPTTPT
jgi:amidase